MKSQSSVLPPVPNIKSVTDMRYKSREIVETLVRDGEAIYLTKDSDPVGIILPIQQYTSIRKQLEALEDIVDAQMMDEFVERDDHVFVDWEEVKRELLEKRKKQKHLSGKNRK